VFACTWKCGQRSRCTHTMRTCTCVPVVVCVARKLRPCPSYSRRRDRNNSVHWRSLYKGGGLQSQSMVQCGSIPCTLPHSHSHSLLMLARLKQPASQAQGDSRESPVRCRFIPFCASCAWTNPPLDFQYAVWIISGQCTLSVVDRSLDGAYTAC